ncbi:hypothetical protein V1509DRAFT_657771 [Lipomyces kononenkoae]
MRAVQSDDQIFSFSGGHQHSNTILLLENTLARARYLNDQVRALANALAEAISPCQEPHNGKYENETLCQNLNRIFQNQAIQELESLEKVKATSMQLCDVLDDHEVLHRLRSTNLPHLEAIWKVFTSGQFGGIISLGSWPKSDEHGGYCGDLIADYGARVIKISRREVLSLKTELTDDTDNLRTRDCIPYLQEFKVAQKLALAVTKPSVEDSLLTYNGLKVLRPSRDVDRQLTIAFCHMSDCKEDLELLEMIKARFELALKQVEAIATSELVERILAKDTRYFSCQIPPVLSFDVTGFNLNFDQSQARLEFQQSLAHNAFSFLKKQIDAERYQSVRGIIVSLIHGTRDRDGKILMCSLSVKNKLLDIVAKMGSSDENRRAQLLFQSDEALHIDREVMLPGIPEIIVLDHSSSICERVAINEELTDLAEFCKSLRAGFMMVTGNFKMAKQLRSKLDGVFGKGILVVEPRSLLG